MSKDNVTRRISIFVNGKEVENSLKGVEGAMSQVRNRLRLLNTDSATYDKDSKELAQTMTDLKQRQSQYRDELGLTNKAMVEANEISGGLRGTLSGIWDSLVSGDIEGAKEGLTSLKNGMGGLLKASLAFIASPIGLAITALAGLAAGAKAMFDFNVEAEKSARLIENLSGKTGQVVEDIRVKIQSLTDTFGVEFEKLAGAVDNLVDTGVAKDELEALDKIKKGILSAPDKNEFIESLEGSAVTAKQVGLDLEEVIALKKQIEETGVDPEATFGALQKAGRNLALQTDVLRKQLTDAFGASFTDEILAKVKTGEMSTVQALDSISKKSKEVSINQTQQAELGNQLFGKSALAAGGYAVVLDTVTSGLEKQNQQLNENQKSSEGLLEANERLNKASDLLRIDGFGSLWDGIKAGFSNAIAGVLEKLNVMKTAIKAFYNIIQNTFISIRNSIISSFIAIVSRISPILEALGVDVDKLKKRLEGFKTQKILLQVDRVNTETTNKDSNDAVKQTAEELKKQKDLRDASRQKEAEERRKAAEKKKAEEEKAAREEYARAKELAEAKANLAKAQLEKYVFDLRSKLEKDKALTPEILALENERLLKIKEAQIKFHNDELARKIADLEAKSKLEGTSIEVLNAQKEALAIDYERRNQELQLGFLESTDALKKQYEEEQKVLKAEQLLLDNELALAEATTKEESDKIKQEQEYQAELQRYAKLYADKKITDDEYTRYKEVAKKKQDEMDRLRELQQLQGTIGGLSQIAGAIGEMFGQSKELAIVQAGINGAMAVTSILAQYPKFDGGFAMWAAIAAAGITTVAQVGKIASAKPPKQPKFFYGGDTGNNPALGYDEYGAITGYVHSDEYVIPKVMRQDPQVANTISWLEGKRQKKLRGFVDGGDTSFGEIPPSDNINTNNETSMLVGAINTLNTILGNGIMAKLFMGYKDIEEIEKMKSELNSSSNNGTIG